MKSKMLKNNIVEIPLLGGIIAFLSRCRRFVSKHDLSAFVNSYYVDKSVGEKRRLKRDLILNYLFRGISYKQFWEQSFDELDKAARRNMLSETELIRFDIRYNPHKDVYIVGNKWHAYNWFKEYYVRECCFVKREAFEESVNAGCEGMDEFVAFANRHKRFIVKPLFKDSGVGVAIVDSEGLDVKTILAKCPQSDFIAEELIVQSDALAKFHPSSVNTLRLNTVRCKDSVEVVWPILRFGRSGNIVDNAHFNGIFSVIDEKSGMAIAAGDVKRHKYVEHPDTHCPLVGFKVPQWEEACELVRLLATKTEGLRFIGWDLAHTDKGWVLVEANTSPGILSPMVTGVGIRKEFMAIKKRM